MRVDPAAVSPATSWARAVILTADKFEDMELFFPYFRLLEEGVAVDVAAPKVELIVGENGYYFENVSLTIDDVDPSQYDLLVIPGGLPSGAPTTVRNSKSAQRITRTFMEAGKPVAAICHGPYTLVSADVVKGRTLTSFWGDGVPEEIIAAKGNYINEPVVVDGNLVTARWPSDLPAFTREMLELLRRYKQY